LIYLDTGCLVKLYYPEPESTRIAAYVQGKPICYTPLHALEFANALQLKVFSRTATSEQVAAARALVETDLKTGILSSVACDWTAVFHQAVTLSEQHSHVLGCRSLDVLHCAAAKLVGADEFVSTDSRQMNLARTM